MTNNLRMKNTPNGREYIIKKKNVTSKICVYYLNYETQIYKFQPHRTTEYKIVVDWMVVAKICSLSSRFLKGT